MELIRVLPRSMAPWRAAFLWLGWGVLGGLLPLWGTALLLGLFGKPFHLFELLKNGEFVLYSASFIGGAMYTIRRDVFPSKNLLNITFCFLIAICLIVFAGITVGMLAQGEEPASSAAQTEFPHMTQTGLTCVSLIVFALSTLACFLVTLAEAGGAGADVPEAMKRDGKTLNASFDALLQAQETKNKEPGK